jgi:hypothetical protein
VAHSFRVIETSTSSLWDFGWFDLTRFQVEDRAVERSDSKVVLRDFLRDPISRRSFCDPGPWGEAIERHGPVLHEKLSVEWFREIASEDFANRIPAALDDPQFRVPPSTEQRRPVEAWAQTARARKDALFVLEPADEQEGRVDWHWVWTVYHEFIAVRPDRKELSVGVIGFD